MITAEALRILLPEASRKVVPVSPIIDEVVLNPDRIVSVRPKEYSLSPWEGNIEDYPFLNMAASGSFLEERPGRGVSQGSPRVQGAINTYGPNGEHTVTYLKPKQRAVVRTFTFEEQTQ